MREGTAAPRAIPHVAPESYPAFKPERDPAFAGIHRCTFKAAEHPGFGGASYVFFPGSWNDIQWRQVNDISAVMCDCMGDPTSEFVNPPIIFQVRN